VVQNFGALSAVRPNDNKLMAAQSRVKPRADGWLRRYVSRIKWTDAMIVTGSVVLAQQIRFGAPEAFVWGELPTSLIVVPLLIGAWIFTLRATQSSDRRIIGEGATEYSRVLTACFTLFGFLAIVDLAFKLNLARGFIAIALPLGTAGLLFSRWMWRWSLNRSRSRRRNLNQVLVVGGRGSAVPLIEHLDNNPRLGYEVVGMCLPSGSDLRHLEIGHRSVPIYGDLSEARDAVALCGATTVAVTSAEALGHIAMRELSWELEGMDVDMLVSPGVTDVAGPRVLVRPVAGLPLLHIDKPRYDGANRFLKALFDRLGAALILVLVSPALVICAASVKATSKGPVFYRAERIGLNNAPFTMWKFRTMIDGADNQKHKLRNENQGAGVLFKIREDPRVTSVGKYLRRYSLDELPQLFNVVNGSMSLVGPRPPLRSEVEQYSGLVTRRMLVRPGITGLWQVSGRSDLSWEESVRLDLSYVENWSITQDAMILWRTVRAVLRSDGAY
jgi:exopolysaccharide biosynthesis polyprenyl glycosylphosphotransferase